VPSSHTVSFSPLGKANGAAFNFLDQQLLSITVIWVHKDSFTNFEKALGRWTTLTKGLVEAFGKADSSFDVEDDAGHGYDWVMAEIDRQLEARFEFEIVDGAENVETVCSITVTNLVVKEKAQSSASDEKPR
jgi:hypothetical protein